MRSGEVEVEVEVEVVGVRDGVEREDRGGKSEIMVGGRRKRWGRERERGRTLIGPRAGGGRSSASPAAGAAGLNLKSRSPFDVLPNTFRPCPALIQ